MQVIQILFLLLFPWIVLKVTGISKKLEFLSPILLCYLIGIIIGNLGFLPADRDLYISVSEVSVPLAIPLILFSVDFKGWLHLARKTVLSFCLVIVSAITGTCLAAWLFSSFVEEYWKLSAMLVGVYTGGTPNLMAIGMALKVSEATLVLANTSDAVTGGVYYIFLLMGAKWLYGKFLPPFKSESNHTVVDTYTEEAVGCSFKGITISVLLSAVFVGLSLGISVLFAGNIDVVIVMLVVTTLGIAASFVKKIRTLKGTYDAGQYIILIFSLAIGMSVDISKLMTTSPAVFFYVVFVLVSTIVFHLVLAKLFRLDVDTVIITSTAGIFGPAFIGPVARALKNREVILSGLTCGLVGYAVGNYLGFLVAWLVVPK